MFWERRSDIFKVVSIALTFAFLTYSLSFAGVFVTRMVVNGDGRSEANEWVELLNSGDSFVFSGLYLSVSNGSEVSFSPASSLKWPAGGLFYFTGSDVCVAPNAFIVGTAVFGRNSFLPNSGGNLSIFFPAQDNLPGDVVSWPNVGGSDNDGRVLYRPGHIDDFSQGDEASFDEPDWNSDLPTEPGSECPVGQRSPVSSTPEPATFAMMLLGLGAFVGRNRKGII